MIYGMADLSRTTNELAVLSAVPAGVSELEGDSELQGDLSTSSAAAPDGSPVLAGLHARLLDRLGLAICGGDLETGSVVRIDQLQERYGVSRSVVREAIRVLASMGMVASRRRVGVQVLPATRWNLYDPQVIRWRLASPARIAQLQSLTELRTAIEPEAARLAAQRASLSGASDLMGLAGKLWAAGQASDAETFLELDIQFHRLVLASSGNEMFAKLTTLVEAVLTGRTQYGLMPRHPHEEALQLHVDVASAIQRGSGDDAHAAMLGIMQRTFEEMSTIWEQNSTD
jgi:DNA-binding FadR family transcriptional regulator